MGKWGYATPEWEGQRGVAFEEWKDGDVVGESRTLSLELTGNPDMDALRIVLKVVNTFTRGY